MTSFNDGPCARAAMITMLVGVLALGVSACDDDHPSSETKNVDVHKIEALSAPSGFEVVDRKPDLELAKQLAASPIPPGFQIHPPRCSPNSTAVTTEQLGTIATRLFQSATSRIAVVAYDAGPNAPFDVPKECEVFTMTGPDGAGAIFAPWTELPKFPGADAVRASHSVIRDQRRSNSYDSYLYTAKVRDHYRILVAISPNPKLQSPQKQSRAGVEDVMTRAVVAVEG